MSKWILILFFFVSYAYSQPYIANAGDLNGDGYDDIIVGTLENQQASVSIHLTPFNNGMADFTLEFKTVTHLAISKAGDVNKDGYGDVMFAVSTEKDHKVYICFGAAKMDAQVDVVLNHSAPGFGKMVASIGDINGDGYGDFVVGATNKVFLYLGDDKINATEKATFSLAESFSNICAAGDVNGDGYGDFAIGASDANKVYIFLGGFKIDQTADVVLTSKNHKQFGRQIASIADVNHDGYADLLVKSQHHSHIHYGGRTVATMQNSTLCSKLTAGSIKLNFNENMEGYAAYGEKDYENGYKKGKKNNSSVMFHINISMQDIKEFVSNPLHQAEIKGYVKSPFLGGKLNITKGVFNLFVDKQKNPPIKNMLYRLFFYDKKGNPVTLSGFKEVKNDGFDVWKDNTTLFVRILKGHIKAEDEKNAKILSSGIMTISFFEVLKLMKSFQVEGGNLCDRIEGFTLFGKFFFDSLWDVYGLKILKIVLG